MGEFPAYTPPKKRKFNLAFNDDNDFEVVSLDRAQTAGRNSGTCASGYNSDSSNEECSTETSRQGPLPDIVRSTRLSAKMFKKFSSSDSESESDEEIAENVKHISEHVKHNSEHKLSDKFMKSANEKLTLPSTTQRMSNVTKKLNTTQQKRFNQSDSGSESDTPMTSFNKKGKRDLVPSVNFFPKKGEGNDNVQSRKLHEDKVHRTKPVGRLPEFRGTAMLDLVAKTSVGKTEPKHQFDGVRYGADILAELFASESSSEESSDAEHNIEDGNTDVPDFTNQQGAIDSLLGLNEEVESNRKAGKKVEMNRIVDLDSEMRSEEESEPEQSNKIKGKVTTDQQREPEGSNIDDLESSGSETESGTEVSESDDDDEKSTNSAATKEQKLQTVKKRDQRRPKEMKTSHTSESSDCEVKSNDNLKEMSPSTKVNLGSVILKQFTNRKDFLLNVSVISEFSSGHVETKDEKQKRDDFSDSEEDLLDMVNSGKMKKVREYEKKAIDDITGIKEKGIKKVTEHENEEKEDKPVGEKNQLVKSGSQKPKDAEKSKCSDDARTSEKKPKTKLEKHALDNQRRMESMRQKEQEIRNHKAAIKKALASIVSIAS